MIKRATVNVKCTECGELFQSEVPHSLKATGTICHKHSNSFKKTVSEVILKTVIERKYIAEIKSNGNSVWVFNGNECLAKFNESTREYQNPKPFEDRYTIYSNLDIQEHNMYFAWEVFVIEVNKRFNILISKEHMPNYIHNPNF